MVGRTAIALRGRVLDRTSLETRPARWKCIISHIMLDELLVEHASRSPPRPSALGKHWIMAEVTERGLSGYQSIFLEKREVLWKPIRLARSLPFAVLLCRLANRNQQLKRSSQCLFSNDYPRPVWHTIGGFRQYLMLSLLRFLSRMKRTPLK